MIVEGGRRQKKRKEKKYYQAMYVYAGYIEGKKRVRDYSIHMENATVVIQE